MNCSDRDIGKRIARLRKEYSKKSGTKLTQDGLAETVKLSRTIIAKIETGVQPLTPGQLEDIAKFFGVSVDYLVTGISSENTTVADELGLANKSIETLKRWQNAFVENGKAESDERGRNRLFALNVLLQSDEGAETLDDIYAYLTTDFENAWYTEDKIESHDGFEAVIAERQNSRPIESLEFDSVINGVNTPVRVPVRFMREAALRDMEKHIENMRRSVRRQYGKVNREG